MVNNSYHIGLVKKFSKNSLEFMDFTLLSFHRTKPNSFTCISYYKDISYKIPGNLRSFSFCVSFKPTDKVNYFFNKIKFQYSNSKLPGVADDVHCENSECVCICESGRSFESRLKKHTSALKNSNLKSKIVQHCLQT